MKLGLAMENGKPEIVTVAELPDRVHQDRPKKYTTKRLVVGVVISVFALAAVAGIVLVSVFFGSKISADSYKMVRQTIKTDDGNVVEEETNVTKNEVDIRIPNVVQIIYDYKHGLVVRRFVDSERGVQSACFARYIYDEKNSVPSNDPDMYDEGEELLHKDNEDGAEEEGQKEEAKEADSGTWTTTDREVPENLISEKVARMCKGTKIFWMEKTQDSGISKRGCSPGTCLYFTIYYRVSGCYYKGYRYTFCYLGGRWQLRATRYLGTYRKC